MKIIVTGGTGFIGEHLVNKLSKNKKNQILILSRKKHNPSFYSFSGKKNISFKNGIDICNLNQLSKEFKGADIVFSLAAMVSYNQKDKLKLIKINKLGAINVLKACKINNVSKLIHLSSSAAFGFPKKIITENTEFNWSKHKKCVYSYSKFLAENILLNDSMNVIVVNPPMVIGPGDKKIFKLIEPIYKGKMSVSTSGRNSFIDVRDLSESMVFLMKKKLDNQKFLVIGGNYSIKEFNSIIASQLGVKKPRYIIPKILGPIIWNLVYLYELIAKNPKINYENMVLAFKDRIHDDSKIRKLGFSTKYSAEESIKDTLEFYKKEK